MITLTRTEKVKYYVTLDEFCDGNLKKENGEAVTEQDCINCFNKKPNSDIIVHDRYNNKGPLSKMLLSMADIIFDHGQPDCSIVVGDEAS